MRERFRRRTGRANLFRPGRSFLVRAVDYDSKVGKQLIDMGITPDTVIYIDGAAPLGEPLVVRVKDYKIALRSADLSALEVEPEDDMVSNMRRIRRKFS